MRYGAKLALLGGIIDYAGTFAPASLPLDKALQKAATFRRGAKHPWLLGKIALPLADIKSLTVESLYAAGADGSPWLYTALGTAVDSPEEIVRTMEWELREARRLNERRFDSSCRQWIVAYEVRLGPEAAAEPFDGVLARLKERAGNSITPFFELGWNDGWKERLSSFGVRLSEWAEEAGKDAPLPGLKFRTGGKEKPTSEQLAFAVSLCTRFGLRFKATQGLHHPLSDGTDFGFVNLFAALAFAQALGDDRFPEPELVRLLEEKSKASFQFGAASLKWSKYEVSCEMIEEARRIHGATFGSCSLDEPDEFLANDFPEEP
jgi:hypothetical protein